MGGKTASQDRFFVEQRDEDFVVIDSGERALDGALRVVATYSGHNARAACIELADWWNGWSLSHDRIGGVS